MCAIKKEILISPRSILCRLQCHINKNLTAPKIVNIEAFFFGQLCSEGVGTKVRHSPVITASEAMKMCHNAEGFAMLFLTLLHSLNS